ncbi:uncharacterized protein PpBr36_06747 [Pyricularia pennisetigena]|uniref:uncharacterized protein n=1 Tax=Pyricularia pennisetigena TaxID=1578925 RepID=UPI00114DF2B5|nr:uncharacterized protein PpBr36_06747 [Pyricularia pennisetigena]TLS23164.1 hypothetical protein PpBr36_06747 [Pyricularia pennisetigena]
MKSISVLVALLAVQAKASYYRVSIVQDPNPNPAVKNPVASIDGEEGKEYIMLYEGEGYRGREPPNVIVPVKIVRGKAVPGRGGLGRGFKLDITPISAGEAVLAEPVNTVPDPSLKEGRYAGRTGGGREKAPPSRKWW